jgi:uncharacterized membrane protein YhaH (DUF805 family)
MRLGETPMNQSLFTSFDGRINRAKWWLGLLVVMLMQWIAWLVVSLAIGAGAMGPLELGIPLPWSN